MKLKIDPRQTEKIQTDVDALTGQYSELSNYFDVISNQIDGAVNEYPLTDEERLPEAEGDVIGQENADLNYQMETVQRIMSVGLGDLFQDIKKTCGLSDEDSLDDAIQNDPELSNTEAAQKVLELYYLYQVLDRNLALDAVMNLEQMRPDYFTGHDKDNIWSALKLLNDSFHDYSNAVKEFILRLEQKK